MEIVVVPKRKDKKHHEILKKATEHFLGKLLLKAHYDRIKKVEIKLSDTIDYGESRGNLREQEYTDGTFDLYIRIDAKEPLTEMISTLAHECVHAKQAVAKDLVIDGNIWKWKGKKYTFTKKWYQFTIAQQCAKLPWENEAYSLEKTLASGFLCNILN